MIPGSPNAGALDSGTSTGGGKGGYGAASGTLDQTATGGGQRGHSWGWLGILGLLGLLGLRRNRSSVTVDSTRTPPPV
jgi:MYXO-CTERM domain-containing protein